MTFSAEPEISVVVPVYKEEKAIAPFLDRLLPVLRRLGQYEVIFCLDPSPDRTEQVIAEFAGSDEGIGLLRFSRRFGQPAATMAGILNCSGRTCAVIDVDLQDPPELLEEMFAKLNEGFDVVYAQRRSRAGETWPKRIITRAGYKLINAIADVQIPRNTGDFRLMSRRVVEELRGLPESHGFLRGLVALVGFPQTAVLYDRDARSTGQGNYNPFLGSLKIAFNGIIGFSTKPLSAMMWTGLSIACLSFVLTIVMLYTKLVMQVDYPIGIPTLTILVLFLGGMQLAALGLIGEYIGRIYDEVRGRPLYIVQRALNVDLRDSHGPGTGVSRKPKNIVEFRVSPTAPPVGEDNMSSRVGYE